MKYNVATSFLVVVIFLLGMVAGFITTVDSQCVFTTEYEDFFEVRVHGLSFWYYGGEDEGEVVNEWVTIEDDMTSWNIISFEGVN